MLPKPSGYGKIGQGFLRRKTLLRGGPRECARERRPKEVGSLLRQGWSSMIFYCPACWREVPELIHVCPYCKVDVERLTLEQDYAQKLIAALDHPEPTTPVRVAWILGVRKETRAIPRLARPVRESDDPYIVEAGGE